MAAEKLLCRLVVPAIELGQVVKWCKALARSAGPRFFCCLYHRRQEGTARGVVYLVVQDVWAASVSALPLHGAVIDNGAIPEEDGLAVDVEELDEAFAVVAPTSKKEAASAEVEWLIAGAEPHVVESPDSESECTTTYHATLHCGSATASLEMRGTQSVPMYRKDVLFEERYIVEQETPAEDAGAPAPVQSPVVQAKWRGDSVDAEELAAAIRRAATLARDYPNARSTGPCMLFDYGDSPTTPLHVMGTDTKSLVVQRLDRCLPASDPLAGEISVPYRNWRVWVDALSYSAKRSAGGGATARVGVVGLSLQEREEARRRAFDEAGGEGTAPPLQSFFLLVTPMGHRFAMAVPDEVAPDWRRVVPEDLDADNRAQGGWAARVDTKALLDAIKRLSRRAKRVRPTSGCIALQVTADPPVFRCVVPALGGMRTCSAPAGGAVPTPLAAVTLPHARVESRGGWLDDEASHDGDRLWALPICADYLAQAAKGLGAERLRLDIPGRVGSPMVLRPADDAASRRLLWLVMPMQL